MVYLQWEIECVEDSNHRWPENTFFKGFSGGSHSKKFTCQCWHGFNPWEDPLEEGNPLQYSCLENPMDRGAWRAIVHRIAVRWDLLYFLLFYRYWLKWEAKEFLPVLFRLFSHTYKSFYLWLLSVSCYQLSTSSFTILSVPELEFKADLTWHIVILLQFSLGTVLFLGNVIC